MTKSFKAQVIHSNFIKIRYTSWTQKL